MSSPARDTSEEAARVQEAIYAAMAPAQRVALACAMSEDARRITMDGIRARHPEYRDTEVQHALFVVLRGAELVAKAWGPAAVVQP